jgi:hypothetical protein
MQTVLLLLLLSTALPACLAAATVPTNATDLYALGLSSLSKVDHLFANELVADFLIYLAEKAPLGQIAARLSIPSAQSTASSSSSSNILHFERAYATTTPLLCDHIRQLLAGKGFTTEATFTLNCANSSGGARRTIKSYSGYEMSSSSTGNDHGSPQHAQSCALAISWGSSIVVALAHLCP